MSALSAAKLGPADRAAPRVNRLLIAVTVALVFFIDALLRLNKAKPGMPDKTGLLWQLLRMSVAAGRRRGEDTAGWHGEANTGRDSLQRVMCLLVEWGSNT